MATRNADNDRSSRNLGYVLASGAFFFWGFHPLYWKRLAFVPAFELLAHRIVWSFFFVGILYFIVRPEKILPALRNRRTLLCLSATSVLIALNWFLYIFAVFSDRIVQASLGYYINPLMNILFGTLFLKERLTGLQKTALSLSFVGVVYLAVDYGSIPWLSLGIAAVFSSYGLLKKLTPLDSLSSLFAETSVLLPFAAAYIILLEIAGTGALFDYGRGTDILLVLGGVVTSFPLLLFGMSTRLIPLSTVGFFQYLSPSIMLLIGIFLYGEPFTLAHGICFASIWTALALYTWSLFKSDSTAQG